MANAAGSGGKSAARLKRRNETKMIMRQPIMLVAILAVIVLLLLFVVYPLVKVLLFSLTDETGAFSLATAAEIFSTSRYLKTFGRTMLLGVIVAVIATFIGYVFAYTITRTNVPCKGFLKTIATLPILSPPFILCLSIIFLFGRQGLITKSLLGIEGNDVYGMGSLIVVQVLSFFPIAYMTLSGILSSIDASVEDAACNMGASRWHTFWTVTFPLSLPGIISGCLLVFIQSLEDFSNPATIGGDFTTLSVEVYQIITGSYDLALPSISDDTITAIESANSNGELTGDVLTTNLVDYRGYGYIGINANLVNVGGDPGSDASKNLRKALMTVMSVYRDTVINSYYGEQASVIQYPISNTSWAAPRPTDEGYQNAYSVDVNGEPIYTDGMTEQERFDAALQAAIGYLQAAGYTWDEATGTFTAAPEGASMTYEFMIPGQGEQDHPAYGVGVSASEALATIGITLQVNDVGTAVWNTALEANTCEIWAAAWQATADPDMYQIYHSSNANGAGTNSNHYQIQDAELDQLIMDGRGSADNDFRAATYKTAMDIIMDWGVELPLYQRKDAIVSSTERVVADSLPQDMTPYWVWYAEIETLAVQ